MALATKDIRVGYELPPLVLTISPEKVNLFSNRTIPRGDPQGKSIVNIHTSEEMAKSAGLPGIVVEGLQVYASISKLMTNFFGEGWVRGGKLSVTFIKIMMPGDTITIKAVVKEKTPEDSATRITLDVWCENQESEKTVVGMASGLVK